MNLSQKYLKSFRNAVSQIKSKRQKLLISVKQKESKELKSEISQYIANCKEIQRVIKEVIVTNESFVISCRIGDNPNLRIVNNLYNACLKRFESVTQAFSQEQSQFAIILRESILKDAEIVLNRKLTNEESDRLASNPSLIETMMSNKLEGKAHNELVRKVSDLEERHHDIVDLEKNVNELYEMFAELQQLIKNQGQMIENIEENILTAKNCTLSAEVDILQSYDYAVSTRKKRCIIIVSVVIIIVIVLSIVLPISL